ncbi:hypothetical protein [Planktothrix paucivesiculata]|uniref:Protein kinase domain-containing protein n=1 Tax=Planktothrix paucivesiculata PCC 9631 TaxID=671071 RepID=A0A7Z9BWH7_9CYAN|nr:hypothetical protein [Planktothrix paucivesiculata]VXD22409.1 hypothetical protein PL9631_660035 [Planktothrix paucivesiculata PCC 9631]
MAWQPGTKLYGDRYTIIKKLGEGGFGITFLARNRKGEDIRHLRNKNGEGYLMVKLDFTPRRDD